MSATVNKRMGVLFDLDGVLLDSEGKYTIFWQLMDEEYHTGIDNFAAFIKGFHLSRILGYFADDQVRQQVVDKLLDFERDMKYEFFPGALGFVKRLKDAGIPMAIVTSSDRSKMQSLYCQHPEFPALFDHIITGDMVTKAKPDPYCFLLGAKLLGIDIKDCVVFEDSRNGLLAGRASGAKVIGVVSTLSREDVAELSDMTVNSVSEISIEHLLECSGIAE